MAGAGSGGAGKEEQAKKEQTQKEQVQKEQAKKEQVYKEQAQEEQAQKEYKQEEPDPGAWRKLLSHVIEGAGGTVEGVAAWSQPDQGHSQKQDQNSTYRCAN